MSAQTVAELAASQGGLVPYHRVTTASTNAAVVKAGPGVVGLAVGFNASAAAVFLKLYDKATAPVVGTDVPAFVAMIPAGSGGGGFVAPTPARLTFLNGIALAVTGGIADADATAVGAGDAVVGIGYL